MVSTSGPNAISRENAQRKIVISANVAGRDLHSVINDIQQNIKTQVSLPEEYHVEYGGQFESEQGRIADPAADLDHFAVDHLHAAVP